MKPPSLPLAEYCDCPGGHHARRYLPQPETPDERALIETYDNAYNHPCRSDLAEAVERFMAGGATAENLAWARDTEGRVLDRLAEAAEQ